MPFSKNIFYTVYSRKHTLITAHKYNQFVKLTLQSKGLCRNNKVSRLKQEQGMSVFIDKRRVTVNFIFQDRFYTWRTHVLLAILLYAQNSFLHC